MALLWALAMLPAQRKRHVRCCRTSSPKNAAMSLAGPTLPTSAVQQVVGYLGYTGRDTKMVAKAARDPKPPRHDLLVD
jgi:hypothetical protein